MIEKNISSAKEKLLKKILSGQVESDIIKHNENLTKVPLSFSQQRLWFLRNLYNESPAYNMYVVIKMQGNYCHAAMEYSFNYLIKNHAMFRTKFILIDDIPYQVAHDYNQTDLSFTDISHLNIELCDTELEKLVQLAIGTPIDLSNDSLLKATVIKTRKDEHILILTMDHLIADGWSLGVISKELSYNYNQYIIGKETTLVKSKITYFDYVTFQHKQCTSDFYKETIDFWQKYIDDDLALIELPCDKKRSTNAVDFLGNRIKLTIPKILKEQLQLLAKEYKVTLFVLLMAAFKILLFKYSGQQDLTIATVVAGRRYKELENLIGIFVNTILIRSKIDSSLSFINFIEQEGEIIKQALEHADLPFENLVKILQPERKLNEVPLFNVMFVLHNTPMHEFSLDDLKTTIMPYHNKTAKFDLLLTLSNFGEEIEGAFEYKTNLFSETLVEQLSKNFLTLLNDLCLYTNKPINKLSILTEDEKRVLLNFNQPKNFLIDFHSVSEMIEFQAARIPEMNALTFEGENLTYYSLNIRVNQLANYMLHIGISEGAFVGISLSVSFELIISILATLKVGAVYVPLDPQSPRDRLEYIIHQANIKYILIDNNDYPCIDQCNTINLHENSNKILAQDQANLKISVTPDCLAYIIFTSGSTGQPKGVKISHGNLTRLFSSTISYFNFSENDVWPLIHSFAFDFSVWEIFGCLLYGGRLVLISNEVKRDLIKLHQLLISEDVTVLNQTPSLFRKLVDIELLYSTKLFNKLRTIIFGGEKVDSISIAKWFERYGEDHPTLINMYGITEITVHATYKRLTKEDLQYPNVPIGNALPDLQIFLLDSNFEPVPRNAIGEIYIAGAGVSKGYLNRDDLTTQRFIDIALQQDYKLNFYKTGDLAKFSSEGELLYCGRADQQIKIHGFRIEVGEIEHWIRKYELVNDVLITTVEQNGSEELVAFLTVNQNDKVKFYQSEISQLNKEQINQWEDIFNHYYASNNENEAIFNINGWVSSYTREALPAIQMQEWVDDTVKVIQSLKPKSVLEIGCGTGLLLSRIATITEYYCGVDISQAALNHVQENIIRNNKEYDNVKLLCSDAANLTGLDHNTFDLVILNSVIQYFPSQSYLNTVLSTVKKHVAECGRLFIGDVRDLRLQKLFHTSVVIRQLQKNDKISNIKQVITERIVNDSELLLDPLYFYSIFACFSEVSHIEVLHKCGRYFNEMNAYRYDVILYFNQKQAVDITATYDWLEESFDLLKVEKLLSQTKKTDVLLIKNIENTLLMNDYSIDKLISESDDEIDFVSTQLPLMSESMINQLSILAERYGFSVKPLYKVVDLPIKFDLVIISHEKMSLPLTLSAINKIPFQEKYTNNPIEVLFNKQFVPRLKEYLKDYLPYYMIPGLVVLVDSFPLTINGKVNIKALMNKLCFKKNITTTYELPRSKTEKSVAKAFSEILSIANISRNDSFFDLGGHSLLATKLMIRMQSLFNKDIPLRYIMIAPTVAGLASLIDTKNFLNNPAYKPYDLLADVYLEESLDFKNLPLEVNNQVKTIFLTGATGFVGIYLLNALLKHTNYHIYCLVRSSDRDSGLDRLIKQFNSYLAWDSHFLSRITVICGDLEIPNLGITEKEFIYLSENLDFILHNAAKVNFAFPYQSLRQANVEGTKTIIKLASSHHLKRIHYVSTLFVFSQIDYQQKYYLSEETEAEHYKQLTMGYTESKWVAEKILLSAAQRGLPLSIYRLNRVAGDSLYGKCQAQDFLWSFVKISIDIGYIPKLNFKINISAVDVIADSIIKLSLIPSKFADKVIYHLQNEASVSFAHLTNVLIDYGYRLKIESYESWRARLLGNNTLDADHPLYALLPIISAMDVNAESLEFDDNKTYILRKEIGAHNCLPDIIMEKTLNYFVETGFFPYPVSKNKSSINVATEQSVVQ